MPKQISAPRHYASTRHRVVQQRHYDGEYRFDVSPVPALQSVDDNERVIYLGTISKTLSPTLRLGYLVLPKRLAPTFAQAKNLVDRHTSELEQAALAHLIESGAYERHVRRARRRNAERRAALLAALGEAFGPAVTVRGAEAGLHLVAWFSEIVWEQEERLITRARGAGLGIYPVGPLYTPSAIPAPRPAAGLVMGYASLDEKDIRTGVTILKRVAGGGCDVQDLA